MEGHPSLAVSYALPQGRKRTKAGRYANDITLAELEACYHLPTDRACKKLGVGLTILKRICRRFGLQRWPYKKSGRRFQEHLSPSDSSMQGQETPRMPLSPSKSAVNRATLEAAAAPAAAGLAAGPGSNAQGLVRGTETMAAAAAAAGTQQPAAAARAGLDDPAAPSAAWNGPLAGLEQLGERSNVSAPELLQQSVAGTQVASPGRQTLSMPELQAPSQAAAYSPQPSPRTRGGSPSGSGKSPQLARGPRASQGSPKQKRAGSKMDMLLEAIQKSEEREGGEEASDDATLSEPNQQSTQPPAGPVRVTAIRPQPTLWHAGIGSAAAAGGAGAVGNGRGRAAGVAGSSSAALLPEQLAALLAGEASGNAVMQFAMCLVEDQPLRRQLMQALASVLPASGGQGGGGIASVAQQAQQLALGAAAGLASGPALAAGGRMCSSELQLLRLQLASVASRGGGGEPAGGAAQKRSWEQMEQPQQVQQQQQAQQAQQPAAAAQAKRHLSLLAARSSAATAAAANFNPFAAARNSSQGLQLGGSGIRQPAGPRAAPIPSLSLNTTTLQEQAAAWLAQGGVAGSAQPGAPLPPSPTQADAVQAAAEAAGAQKSCSALPAAADNSQPAGAPSAALSAPEVSLLSLHGVHQLSVNSGDLKPGQAQGQAGSASAMPPPPPRPDSSSAKRQRSGMLTSGHPILSASQQAQLAQHLEGYGSQEASHLLATVLGFAQAASSGAVQEGSAQENPQQAQQAQQAAVAAAAAAGASKGAEGSWASERGGDGGSWEAGYSPFQQLSQQEPEAEAHQGLEELAQQAQQAQQQGQQGQHVNALVQRAMQLLAVLQQRRSGALGSLSLDRSASSSSSSTLCSPALLRMMNSAHLARSQSLQQPPAAAVAPAAQQQAQPPQQTQVLPPRAAPPAAVGITAQQQQQQQQLAAYQALLQARAAASKQPTLQQARDYIATLAAMQRNGSLESVASVPARGFSLELASMPQWPPAGAPNSGPLPANPQDPSTHGAGA